MKKFVVFILIVLFPAFLNGQKPVDLLLKAKALTESGKPSEGINLLTDALGQSSDYRIYLQRAEAYMAAGDYSKAINDLNSANLITPFSGEYYLARIYGLKGDAATAVYHLEQCLRSDFKKSEKEIMLDPSFSIIENRPEWKQFWKKEWYSLDEKSVSEIEYYLSTSNLEEAKNILSLLSRQYPENRNTIYAGAIINLAGMKYSETIKALTILLAEKPENEKYLRVLGKAQESSGNFAGAINTYTKMLETGIPDPELLISRSDCYKKTGQLDKALQDVEKYLDCYPESVKALGMAGRLESARGDNLKAIEYFNKNLKLHPFDPQCYIDRGNSYFTSRSWEFAIKDYSMSLDLQPGNSDVWLNKGISLLNSGKINDACFDFRKSLSLGNKKATEYVSRNCIK